MIMVPGAPGGALAMETVPDIDEAEALMTAIAGLGIPAWLGCCRVRPAGIAEIARTAHSAPARNP